jgi:TP901 family phage tail tape measure protein
MNISVRVISAQAQAQIKALQAEIATLRTQLAATNKVGAASSLFGGGGGKSRSLAAFGSQLQWTGRQLQYNFTAPLLVAAGASMKFAMDNEKAFVRVQKVYGDTADATAYFRANQSQIPAGMNAGQAAAAAFSNELDALQESFEKLSTTYGISQTEVLDTASAWAAAGVSGTALAKATELSIRASLLGDIDLAKATESLIAIQSQYSLSTKGLALTIAELNAIENATGVSQAGLIDAFSRAAGSAREYGVDVRHLGAMIAALVPATGTASTAGNALKTIMSRIMAPTKEASALMREFGVDTADAAWQSSSAMDRLMILAGKMKDDVKGVGPAGENAADGLNKMSDSQRAVVATTLGSRYQVNRFLVLMRELNEENGYYAKALSATKNNQKVFATAQRELNAILDSSPKKLEILWYTIQNGLADAIQPMIPYFLYMVSVIGDAVKAFNNLDPAVQKLILTVLFGVAAFGIIVKLMGAFFVLVGTALTPIRFLAVGFASLFVNLGATAAAGSLVTRSWISMLAWMVKTPFRVLLAGFAMLPRMMLLAGAGVIRLIKTFILLPRLIFISMTAMRAVVVAAWVSIQATWVAAMASLRIITALGAAANAGIWAVMGARMRVLSLASWMSIRAIWVAGMAMLQLVSTVGMRAVVTTLARYAVAAGAALLGPWGIAIAAAALVIVMFRKQIMTIWNNLVSYFGDSSNGLVRSIINAFNALPQGVQNAMIAVVNVVKSAAMAIYDLFSYINPFAHHSPSLVENVENGAARVSAGFGSMANNISGHIAHAYAEIRKFGNAAQGLLGKANQMDFNQDLAKVKKYAPGLAGMFSKLHAELKPLQADMAALTQVIDKQQKVVDKWQAKLDQANLKLDEQSNKLDKLKDKQQQWQDLLDGANDKLDKFANAPLVGMRAMSDAIFENEIAQKRLRLAMMDMEDQGGQSFDSLKAKVDALNGAMELVSGERNSLRDAGAGSDILGVYDDQIAALQAQQVEYAHNSDSLQNMQDQLDALGRQGERLDLLNSLQFDPLTRQIDQAANAMEELPFDQVMTGVTSARAEIDRYTTGLDAATAAVDAQQKVVDALTAARDKIQLSYDAENAKLQKMKDSYDALNDVIQKIESSMSDVVAAADAMHQAMEDKKKKKKGGDEYTPNAVQNFRDAKGGNFADIGGAGIPIRTDWSDQSDQIKKFTEGIGDDMTDAFKDINPFGPLKSKWNDFRGWISKNLGPVKDEFKDMFVGLFDGVGGGGSNPLKKMLDLDAVQKARDAYDSLKPIFSAVGDVLGDMGKKVQKVAGYVSDLFGPDIREISRILRDEFGKAWENLKPQLEAFVPLIKPIGQAIKNIWEMAKPGLALLVAAIGLIGKVFLNIVMNVLPPIITNIMGLIGNVIQIFRGLIEFVVGIVNGDWKMALQGLYDIVEGTFGGIWNIIKGIVQPIWGVVSGLVEGIVGFFKWLWDVLVGHSIIPDLVNAVWDWIKKWITIGKWVWDNVLNPVYNKFKDAWNFIREEISQWWERIKGLWNGLTNAAQWVWTNFGSPVVNKIKDAWTNVKAELGDWWERIKNTWSALTGVGAWLKDNFADPIFDKITGVWTRISTWFTNNKDTLMSPIKGVVNAVIGGINKLITGLNKISDVLPKFEWHIEPITEMANGGQVPGRRGNRGFKTSGARAIVGEGKQNYPEFVIPTDPTYRQRAHSLLAMAASKLGAGVVRDNGRAKGVRGDTVQDFIKVARDNPKASLDAVPQFGIGGFISNTLSTVKDWTEGLAIDSLGLVMNPALKGAEALVNAAGEWPPPKAPALSAINSARGWFDSVNDDYQSQFKKDSGPPANIKGAQQFAKSQVGKPYTWGGVGANDGGYDCSGFMSAITNVIRGNPIHSRVGATGSFPWGGFGPGVDPNKGFVIGSSPNYGGSGIGHMAGTLGGMNVESRGGQGVITGPGARGWNDSGFSIHAGIKGLKEGGIVPAGTDRLYRLGDGRYDEAVVPLPKGYRDTHLTSSNDGGEKHFHFHGDLSFPNIKSGDDAQSFIENLESLVKD